MDQLAPKTDTLIGLGADLAATFGGTTADAVGAISALLRGERDPIEKYGVSIKEADVNARKAADGTDKLTGSAAKQADAQATLALLTDQTASAQGQFSRESDTAAGAQQRASAEYENASAALGTSLLPLMTTFSTILAGVSQFVADNTTAVTILVGILGALAAAVLIINGALKVYNAYTAVSAAITKFYGKQLITTRIQLALMAAWQKAQAAASKIAAAAQWLLNAALTANPIGLVVAAIALLIGGLILAYKKSETFRKIVDAAFKAVLSVAKSTIGVLGDIFGTVFGAIKGFIDPVIEAMKTLFEWIGKVIDFIGKIKVPKIKGSSVRARQVRVGDLDLGRDLADAVRCDPLDPLGGRGDLERADRQRVRIPRPDRHGPHDRPRPAHR